MSSKMSITPFEEFVFEPITKERHVTENIDKWGDSPKYWKHRNSIKIQHYLNTIRRECFK